VTELRQRAGDNFFKQWELGSTELEGELASVGCCAVKRMLRALRPQNPQSAFVARRHNLSSCLNGIVSACCLISRRARAALGGKAQVEK